MYLYFENNVEEQRELLKLNNEVIEDDSTDFMNWYIWCKYFMIEWLGRILWERVFCWWIWLG